MLREKKVHLVHLFSEEITVDTNILMHIKYSIFKLVHLN